MITVVIHLACDGPDCNKPFPGDVVRSNVVFRRDLESLRAAAAKRGWQRFRTSNTSSMGDYCPRCSKALRATKGKARS